MTAGLRTFAAIDDILPSVAAAAFLYGKTVYSLPPPARHQDVMRHIVETLDLKETPWPLPGKAGFVCSDGTFLGPRAAARQAFYCKQIEEPKHRSGGGLVTEDLW